MFCAAWKVPQVPQRRVVSSFDNPRQCSSSPVRLARLTSIKGAKTQALAQLIDPAFWGLFLTACTLWTLRALSDKSSQVYLVLRQSTGGEMTPLDDALPAKWAASNPLPKQEHGRQMQSGVPPYFIPLAAGSWCQLAPLGTSPDSLAARSRPPARAVNDTPGLSRVVFVRRPRRQLVKASV